MKNKSVLVLTLVILAVLAAVFFIYKMQVKRKSEITTEIMKSTGDQQIDSLLTTLSKSMKDYMQDANPPYSQKDIDECVSILSNYTQNIFATRSKEDGREIVKSTVLKLNALNAKCDHSLIETSEREQIAEIIILASHRMKYNSMEEDITEEWREW